MICSELVQLNTTGRGPLNLQYVLIPPVENYWRNRKPSFLVLQCQRTRLGIGVIALFCHNKTKQSMLLIAFERHVDRNILFVKNIKVLLASNEFQPKADIHLSAIGYPYI